SPPACNETGSRGGGPRAWTPTAPRRRSGCSWYQRSTRVEVEHEVVLVPRRGSIEVAPGAAHELTQGPVGLGQDDPEMLQTTSVPVLVQWHEVRDMERDDGSGLIHGKLALPVVRKAPPASPAV